MTQIRLSHILWVADRKDLALAIQSRCTEVFGVDIHPAAKIGGGLMLDHGTGVVIGETTVVGENCSFLHGITLVRNVIILFLICRFVYVLFFFSYSFLEEEYFILFSLTTKSY